MIKVTEADRAAVLAEYRRRRRFRLESPQHEMRGAMNSYASVQMMILAHGGAVDWSLVSRWAAAREYETIMLERGGYWIHRTRRPA